MPEIKHIRITLLRSTLGTSLKHKATVRALGLRHIRQSVTQADTPQIRGMLAKVGHLVKVEEAQMPVVATVPEVK